MNRIIVSALTLSTFLVLAACTPQAPITAEQDAAAAAPATPAVAPAALIITSWAPRSTKAGTGFNLQPDGNSGVFFELSGEVPQVPFTVSFDNKPLSGVVASGNVVTATIPADYLATAGEYTVEVQIPSEGVRLPPVTFTVEAL